MKQKAVRSVWNEVDFDFDKEVGGDLEESQISEYNERWDALEAYKNIKTNEIAETEKRKVDLKIFRNLGGRKPKWRPRKLLSR